MIKQPIAYVITFEFQLSPHLKYVSPITKDFIIFANSRYEYPSPHNARSSQT